MFFDKLCTISTVSYTTVKWQRQRSLTALYSNIQCNFEQNKKKLYNPDYANNVNVPDYTIVIPVQYNAVRENMTIVLTDPILWNMGTYVISSVNANKSITWGVDCITLLAQIDKWL